MGGRLRESYMKNFKIQSKEMGASYPFSNDVSELYPKYINIFTAIIIISVFCVVCTPWNIIKNAACSLHLTSSVLR